MISSAIQRLKYIVSDLLAANAGMFLFNVFRFYTLEESASRFSSLSAYLSSSSIVIEQILIPILILGIYWLSGFYNKPFHKSRLQEIITTASSILVTTILIYLALLTNDQVSLRSTNYELLVALFLSIFLPTYIGRATITLLAIRHIRCNEWNFNSLMIGTSESALKVSDALKKSRHQTGYNIVAHVSIPGENGVIPSDAGLDNISAIIKEKNIRYIILVPESHNDSRILRIVDKLFPLGIPIKIAPDTLSLITASIRLQDIYGEPFIDITSPNISESAKNIKRIMDITISITALTLLALPMLIITILIKKDSKGPVFYVQERIGYHQRPFNIYKFRTMRIDAEKDGPRLSSSTDSRITRIGHILRKYRIDELPQFWNVLKGDMSLVGPRPEREYFIRKIIEQAPYYTLVSQVRPGITSWGMVKYGYASSIDQMVKRLRFDLIYLANMSTVVDLKILIHTVKTILTGKGM